MHAFDTVLVGPLKLANRLVMAPVKTALGGPDAKVTDRLIAYYRRRARGGVSAIIVEPLFVDAVGKEHPRQLGLDADDKIEGLRRLVDAIQQEGARAIAHLNHAGRAANPKASGRAPEAPSALRCPTTGATAEPMSEPRIEEVIEAFGQAAVRAREAGFDGIEVQCGLGYLVAQFLSARTNQRDDAWGGSAQNRQRFVEQVIRRVRQAAGDRVAVTARLSGTEQVDGGLVLEDALRLGRLLTDLGVAAVHVVSGSACDSPPWYYQHMSLPPRANLELARAVRRSVDVPVMVAGRLGAPEDIERLFAEDAADLVALGRPLVADPDLPNKLRRGEAELVVRCGGCLQGCLAGVKSGKGIACIVNPELGREETVLPAPDTRKNVVVVGGGPAGLTAARIAADRGHHVTLLERSARELGGQFAAAHLAPGKEPMREVLGSMVRRAARGNLDIRMGTEATLDGILGLRPDVVLVATGAEPIVPAIPGLGGALTGQQVLSGAVPVGRRVLVIGGGLVGIEVAEHLAGHGHEVVVVEMMGEIARDMEPITRKLTLDRLAKLPVTVHTETKVTSLVDGRATGAGPEGDRAIGTFDSVVAAVGTRPVDRLARELRDRQVTVHTIGDAREIGQVQGAVTSAWEIASRL